MPAAAAPASLTASPAIQELQVQPGTSAISFSATLTNDSSQSVVVAVKAQDVISLGQDGSITFIDPSQSASDSQGLADRITTVSNHVTIGANASQTIKFDITSVNTLSPGGHYAAVVYTVVGASNAGGATVNLQPAVSTLVFITTAGTGTQSLKLAPLTIGSFRTDVPARLNLVFTNTGNVQTAVRGYTQIYGPRGDLVSQGVLNVDSGLVLPGAERLFAARLTPQTNAPLWPGAYKVKVFYRYDGEARYTEFQQSFLLINQALIIGGSVTLLLALGVILWATTPARRYLLRRVHKR